MNELFGAFALARRLNKRREIEADAILRKAPADEPVYQFLDTKRAEGKPCFVYMTAAQNKFLRIYCAKVIVPISTASTDISTEHA